MRQPELWIYNPLMLGAPGLRQDRLTWRIEITPLELAPIRELVLVDAALGNVTLSFNQVDTARVRSTYTANNTTSLPGTFVCGEGDPSCSAGDAHAQAAHIFAGATYDFYWAQHGRDSFDNLGGTLISTVHYGSGFQNAFWSGTQMVYGDAHGYPLADDVVAHELTHGVTQYTWDGIYQGESGALNEAFSDIILAVAEHLVRLGRTGTVLVVRAVSSDYWAPLGTWVVREATRQALKGPPEVFPSFTAALPHLASRLGGYGWLEGSVLIPELRSQRRLSDY